MRCCPPAGRPAPRPDSSAGPDSSDDLDPDYPAAASAASRLGVSERSLRV
jgi:hypothetical protein